MGTAGGVLPEVASVCWQGRERETRIHLQSTEYGMESGNFIGADGLGGVSATAEKIRKLVRRYVDEYGVCVCECG